MMTTARASRIEAETIALRALTYVIGDETLRPRLLDMTGLEVGTLRIRAGDPALLAATLGFLEAHEPSLIACASALDIAPAELLAAHHTLDRRAHD